VPRDDASAAPGISRTTARLCRRWAVEKLATTLARLRAQQLYRVLTRWREAAALTENARRVRASVRRSHFFLPRSDWHCSG
jgi:hypothetical protein